jgi:hypothetical protein
MTKNYKFKVLGLAESKEWSELVDKAGGDNYFFPEYAKIYNYSYGPEIDEVFQGEPLLFFYGNDEEFLVQPFVKRRINNLPFLRENEDNFRQISEEYFDLISPYGYAGPLTYFGKIIRGCDPEQVGNSAKTAERAEQTKLTEGYLKESASYCFKHNIVTEFVRFHPLMENQKIFSNIKSDDNLTGIEISGRNNTVTINLEKGQTRIWEHLDKKTRNLIRKAEKSGIKIERADDAQTIKIFSELYNKTMIRNSARKEYIFTESYFFKTAELMKDKAMILTAKHDNKIIAASMFLCHGDFFHYHFSGSDNRFLSLAPNNLLINEAIKTAIAGGYKKMHLGGGNSGKEDDPLYHFKKGFSPDLTRFYTGNRTYNLKIYKLLSELKKRHDLTRDVQGRANFFPEYRA